MNVRSVWLAAIGLLMAGRPAFSQPDVCKSAPAVPSDVTVQLTLAVGRTDYQQGEIVPLRLAFASSAAGKYFIETRNYDRSGRLMIDVMCLEPDTADPLADYFGSGLFGLIGGGLGGQPELKAHEIALELNEWKALPPGRYRLRVASGRISRVTAEGRDRGSSPVPVTSNAVEFRVLPAAPEWQAGELATARAELDGSTDPVRTRRAARVLRFLGSEAASDELARRYDSLTQPNGWDLMFGLVASPHRERIIRSMTAALSDPQHPISRSFIDTLALLEIESDPSRKPPPYQAADLQRLVARHIDELAAVLAAKTGQARAISVETVFTSPTQTDPAARARLGDLLIASWDSLPVRTRNELIQYRWDQIRGAGMLPVLRRIVNDPVSGSGVDRVERGPALRRLYELSPNEGRELILREMVAGARDVGIDVLGMLPDRELPQIEAPILARLRQDAMREGDYGVIDRYGSSRFFDELRSQYDLRAGRWACAPQSSMLRYFLRIDPAYGARAVADAMTHRGVTGCYKAVLSSVGAALQDPAVQSLAVAALHDSSYDVVGDAARALGRYGAADAEARLWQRLREFHDAWKDKDAQLRYVPSATGEDMAPAGAESALVDAIAKGQAWLSGPDDLESLKPLVSSVLRPEVDRMLRQWEDHPIPLSVIWSPRGELTYSVAYMTGQTLPALKQKLQQFPPRTDFICVLSESASAAHAAEIAEIESAAAAAGLILTVRKTP